MSQLYLTIFLTTFGVTCHCTSNLILQGKPFLTVILVLLKHTTRSNLHYRCLNITEGWSGVGGGMGRFLQIALLITHAKLNSMIKLGGE